MTWRSDKANLAALKQALTRPCTNCGAKIYVPCHDGPKGWGVCGSRLTAGPIFKNFINPPGR